ncbi:hypothetical protein C0J52_22547 [Blattella germanica]|nr:hypothetical protein C0J52_22547 [Blattella germanica]
MQDRITRPCSAFNSDEIQRVVLSTSMHACMGANGYHFEHILTHVNRHAILVSFYAFANAFVKGKHHDLRNIMHCMRFECIIKR